MKPFTLHLLLLYAALLIGTSGQEVELSSLCRSLPRASFLQAQQADLICDHFAHWNHESRKPLSKEATTSKQLQYLKDVERCTRVDCTRRAKRAKRQSMKSIRKEIRMMSPEERAAIWDAMNKLKSRMVDNITAWDLHTLVHYPDSAPGAHWGPAFLPWHREFLRQFEVALQREVPGVSLPYWDSTLDQGLPDPADSVLWTDALLGNGNGYVKSGPFRDWATNVLMPLSAVPVKRLYRMTGGRSQDRLMNPKDLNWILSRKKFQDLVFCHDSTFESIHGLSHAWVGGFMFVIRVSPNDPAFYMHHAFIDHIWEQFRQKNQDRYQRENDWSEKTCSKHQEAYGQMKPFALQNRDGLSNNYTDFWYEYQPIEHCTLDRPFCDSPYLWCDLPMKRCRSRVVRGGNCTGFEGTSICHESMCIGNVCRLPEAISPTREHLPQTPAHKLTDVVWTKTILLDSDAKPFDDPLASVTVIDHSSWENTTVYMETSTEYPEIPGLVYVPLPKPRPGIVHELTLETKDGFGRLCQAQCYNDTLERYQVCEPKLSVSAVLELSSPIAYTHSVATKRFLDVDLGVHPRQVMPALPYMIFACTRRVLTSAQVEAVLDQVVQPPQSRVTLVWFRVAVHRSDFREMQVEVRPLDGSSDSWFASVSRAASPYDPSLIFVQAPNPELWQVDGVRVEVSLLENGQRVKCAAKCTLEDGSLVECDGQLELHVDASRADEPVYTSDERALAVLGWTMRRHPAHWRHRVPYLSFYC